MIKFKSNKINNKKSQHWKIRRMVGRRRKRRKRKRRRKSRTMKKKEKRRKMKLTMS